MGAAITLDGGGPALAVAPPDVLPACVEPGPTSGFGVFRVMPGCTAPDMPPHSIAVIDLTSGYQGPATYLLDLGMGPALYAMHWRPDLDAFELWADPGHKFTASGSRVLLSIVGRMAWKVLPC